MKASAVLSFEINKRTNLQFINLQAHKLHEVSSNNSLVIHWRHASQSKSIVEKLSRAAKKERFELVHQFLKEQRSFSERLEPDFCFQCSPDYQGVVIWKESYVVVGPRKANLKALSQASMLNSLNAFYEHLWKARLLLLTRGDGTVPHKIEQQAWRSYLKLGTHLVPVAQHVYVYPESAMAGLEKAEKLQAFYMVDRETWEQEAYRLDLEVWLEGLPELEVPCYFQRKEDLFLFKKSKKDAFMEWIWIHQLWEPSS